MLTFPFLVMYARTQTHTHTEFDIPAALDKFTTLAHPNNLGVLHFYAGELVQALDLFTPLADPAGQANRRVLQDLGIKSSGLRATASLL